jgi:hypothetical protein
MPLPTGIHPEFGYLAPTPQFRRGLRIAAIAGVVGALFGAASVLALATRHDRASAPAEPTELARVSSMAAEAAELAQVGSVAVEPPGSVLPITTADIARPAAKPCSEQISFDRERKCRFGNSRRWRHIRVVPADSPPAAVEPATTAGLGNETVAPREPAASPPPEPASSATSLRKTASKRTRSRSRENDRFDPGTTYAASTATRPDWQDWRGPDDRHWRGPEDRRSRRFWREDPDGWNPPQPEDRRSRRSWRQDPDGWNPPQPDPWRRRDGWGW